jgi:hypothetical protein
MYDAKAGSELAARYSDTKEAVHEAIALAPRLKLTRQTKRLKKRGGRVPGRRASRGA